MPVTLTIKSVPDDVAAALRLRAQQHRRSLQQELLLIAEQAAVATASSHIGEPERAVYTVRKGATARRSAGTSGGRGQRLSLDQLWQRARALGEPGPAESAAIVRRDRDARHGR